MDFNFNSPLALLMNAVFCRFLFQYNVSSALYEVERIELHSTSNIKEGNDAFSCISNLASYNSERMAHATILLEHLTVSTLSEDKILSGIKETANEELRKK